MSDAERLLRLRSLDEQLVRWREQRNRDGLEAYSNRRERSALAWQHWQTAVSAAQTTLENGQKELDSAAGSARDAIQDRLLEAMISLEELEPQGARLKESLQEAEADLAEAVPEEQERVEALDLRLRAGEQERQQLLDALPRELSSGYEAGRRRTGIGITGVANGRCLACRVQLTDHDQRRLRLGEALLCQTCQAVLVKEDAKA